MRNLKTGMIVLSALLTLWAMAGSVASADEFTSESSSVSLFGELDAGTSPIFTITAGNLTCKEVQYSGTGTTPTTTIKATPTTPEKTKGGEQNCTALSFPGTMSANGCAYASTINSGASTSGGGSIECSSGNEVTGLSIGAETVKCTIHVPPQTLPANSVTVATIGAGTTKGITVSISISSAVKYSHTKGTGLGACTTGSGTTGSFTSKGVLAGSSDLGGSGHVGVFLS